MRREKIFTFNGCWRSAISVTPVNWNTQKASVRRPWRISYRFYDPAFKGTRHWGKQLPIKGMNDLRDLVERQSMTRYLIQKELNELDKLGFNPVTGKYMEPKKSLEAVEKLCADTPFIRALRLAIPFSTAGKQSKEGMRTAVNIIYQAAEYLDLAEVPVKEITSGHIMDCLAECHRATKISPRKDDNGKLLPIEWNDNQYNFVRAYVCMAFKVLVRIRQLLPYNPVHNVPKKEILKEPDQKARILTDEERKVVVELLNEFPDFKRYVNIFYAAGSRITEFARLQGKHVKLKERGFWVLILKGRKQKWAWKTITNAALPYWTEAMQDCGPDDYVFSAGLKPGPTAIRPEQITRRWKKHIKQRLGIDVDFYKLKHLFNSDVIDQVMEQEKARKVALQVIAIQNAHANTEMADRVYDVRKEDREHTFKKTLGGAFGK